jgi:Mlc titration factor MtfA (ptsG expression regulator)
VNEPRVLSAILVAIALAALFWGLAVPRLQRRKRLARAARPLPAVSSDLLRVRLPVYDELPQPLRQKLDGALQIFLAEKTFVGCNGLTVTDEMRLVIAAHACLLVVNRPGVPERGVYPELHSILVYPDEFVVHETWEDEDGIVTEGRQVLSGQAWDASRIILSWADVREAEGDYNVVVHEFAHYLDMEDDAMNGAPALGTRDRYAAWSQAFTAEYERLEAQLEAGRDTFLDPYAATDPAEFFAVVTETFLGEPHELAHEHPALHELLVEYYGYDPRDWTSPRTD